MSNDEPSLVAGDKILMISHPTRRRTWSERLWFRLSHPFTPMIDENPNGVWIVTNPDEPEKSMVAPKT